MSHAHTTGNHGHSGAAVIDSTDPHGETHHTHVIVSAKTLMNVLLILLFFTILTVAASRAEVWAAATFHVEIPQWVNVMVAMSIAVVKGTLVLLFFMQLKYDNKLNAIIFANCIFALGLFLFFTMTDLGNRGAVYEWKKGEIKVGGLGGVTRGRGDHKESIDKGVTQFSREKWLAIWGPEKFAQIEASVKHGDHGHGHDASTPNVSREVRGQTGALSATAPSHDDHGHAHDNHDTHDAHDTHGEDSHDAPAADAPADAHSEKPAEPAPAGGH